MTSQSSPRGAATAAIGVGAPPKISARNVDVVFEREGREPLLAATNCTLDVAPGEFVAIVGPSGCGKTTLLNVIAGLRSPSAGEVTIDGVPVREINRLVGYMFARDGLLPWRTAQANVELGLEFRGLPSARRSERARELLAMVGLQGFEDRHRHELSQGMRQRVALARTFAPDPDVLLMDEPFAALDAQTKQILQQEFLRIWEHNQKTVVWVTHDLNEAIVMADRVAVFSARPGTIKAIFDISLPRPRSLEELRFHPTFAAIYERIWSVLRDEVVRAAHDV